MVSDDFENLKVKLSPEAVRLTLIRAGCFLTAYELIKVSVLDEVKGFFCNGIKDGEFTYDEDSYRRSVLSLSEDGRFDASCKWLVLMEALTEDEAALLREVHIHRMEIAHELPRLLVDPNFFVKADLLVKAIECLRALGVFWGSIAVQTDPTWDGEEVDYTEIKSGSLLLMEYLASLANLESP